MELILQAIRDVEQTKRIWEDKQAHPVSTAS